MSQFPKHDTHGRIALLAAALAPLLLSGCIIEDNPCPDDITGSDGTWLSMRVVNTGSLPGRSRAADDAGHPDESASAAENHIDGADMSLMLFDNRQLLRHIFNPDEYTVQPDGDGYMLRFKLNSDYFSYASSMSSVDFSLMVVANRTGLGEYAAPFDDRYLSMTPAQIAALYPQFDMPSQNAAAWLPDGASRRIPMSGTATFTGIDLSVVNTADNPLMLGTVDMQRDLCKVRVLADLQGQGGSDYDRIISVTITGGKQGAFIPVVADTPGSWYQATKVLETPTGHESWWDDTDAVAMHAAPQTSIITNQTYQNSFYCYVPEAVLTGHDATLSITANYKDNPDQTKTWEIPLSQAYGESFGGLESFVRNHIYEFTVQAVSGAPLDLTLNVLDWEAQTVEWDYSDNPGVAEGGWLEWPADLLNGATLPPGSTARLVFGTDQTRAATGTFQFSQPLGGTWTASFAPLGDTEADAFCFVDTDGSLVGTISGRIAEGTRSSIQVRPRHAPGQQRSAQLVFTVRTPDGRTLTGDLVDGEPRHFTVVQNSQ